MRHTGGGYAVCADDDAVVAFRIVAAADTTLEARVVGVFGRLAAAALSL